MDLIKNVSFHGIHLQHRGLHIFCLFFDFSFLFVSFVYENVKLAFVSFYIHHHCHVYDLSDNGHEVDQGQTNGGSNGHVEQGEQRKFSHLLKAFKHIAVHFTSILSFSVFE